MPTPKPLTDAQAKRSLANRLAPKADRIRQIATKLGIRPYRVFLVWVVYSASERGEGREKEIRRKEILPTPLVESLDAVARNPYAVGIVPEGSIRVSRVSVQSFTSDELAGRAPGEVLIPDPYGFFYEVVEDGRHGMEQHRQKYRLSAQPMLQPDRVQWMIVLERISEDRDTKGKSQLGPDDD